MTSKKKVCPYRYVYKETLNKNNSPIKRVMDAYDKCYEERCPYYNTNQDKGSFCTRADSNNIGRRGGNYE